MKIILLELLTWKTHLTHLNMYDVIVQLMKLSMVHGTKKLLLNVQTIANGEHFMVLGLICYCDKTGTDVYQQHSLEPFSFTFCMFN